MLVLTGSNLQHTHICAVLHSDRAPIISLYREPHSALSYKTFITKLPLDLPQQLYRVQIVSKDKSFRPSNELPLLLGTSTCHRCPSEEWSILPAVTILPSKLEMPHLTFGVTSSTQCPNAALVLPQVPRQSSFEYTMLEITQSSEGACPLPESQSAEHIIEEHTYDLQSAIEQGTSQPVFEREMNRLLNEMIPKDAAADVGEALPLTDTGLERAPSLEYADYDFSLPRCDSNPFASLA